MTMVTTEVEVAKRDRRGRRITPAARRAELVASYRAGGMTMEEFARRSAIIYSIVVSCQRHRKDPLASLRDLLTRLPTMTNHDDLDALTPLNWQPA